MTGLLTLLGVLLASWVVHGCPESCCIDAPIFMFEEDKCLLTKNSQQLTAAILRELGKTDTNLFISPFSVNNILQLLLLASTGETTEELSRALSATTVDIHGASKCLSEKVLYVSDPTLNNTNDFFVNNGYESKDHGFIRQAKEYYGASFHNCNFEKRPERARKRINKIVSVKSNYMINDLFEPGSIHNNTKSVIVNTISFQSTWFHQFDKDLTRNGNFHVTPEKTTETPLMRAEGSFYRKWVSNILNDKTKNPLPIEILDMPYESAQYSMMAIKFSKRENFFQDLGLIEQFVAENGILTIKSILESSPLEVTFPRFKMEYDRDMNEIFTPETGLGIVFSPRANYSGFVDDFHISNIIHKAAIVVTEEGTIASGASGGHFIQRQSQSMVFNSPFVFFVYHACDGLVLFQGRYAYPPNLPVETPQYKGHSHRT